MILQPESEDMDFEQIRICRDTLLKEASRLSKLLNSREAVEPDWEEILLIHGCDIVNDQTVDATYLSDALVFEGRSISPRSMGFQLRAMGYVPVKSRRVKISGQYHYVWFKPSLVTERDAIFQVRHYHKEKAP